MSRWLSLCLATATILGARIAEARPEFPAVIARELGAPRDPACSICHLGGKTSGATVETAFAWTMRAHGLSGSPSSVQTAILEVMKDGVDSDGDGVPDWQEIVDGTDPNEPGTAADIRDPQLGCRVVGGRPGHGVAVSLAVALVVATRRRRHVATAK